MNLSENQIREILNRIEVLIAGNQMKKKDFYAQTGVSSSLYSQWNTGKVKPSRQFLTNISNLFGVDFDQLVYGSTPEDIKKITATKDGDGLTETHIELIKLIATLTEPQARYILSKTKDIIEYSQYIGS